MPRPTEELVLHVLHVLPVDVARGAQVYARALADHANRIPGERHEVVVLFAGPRVAALADHELHVPVGRSSAAGLDPRAAWRLWRLVRRVRPDVVVAHGADSMKYAIAVRRLCPVVCHAIGVVSPKALQGPSRLLHTTLLRGASMVTAVSTAVADELHERFGLQREAIRVIPNGREPAVFAGAEAAAVGSIPKVVFVGHLTRTKRPEVFIDVIAALRANGCELEAQIVGAGPLEAEIATSAAAAGVALLGRRSDVPELLQKASVFVFPSVTEGEGMPGVLIEAGLAGLPVVATDVPGARDVIVDGETGRVVAEDDLSTLAEAVEDLVRDEPLRRAMGAAARDRCARLFSLDASTELFLDALSTLVEQRLDEDGTRLIA